jgi:hypothetical protein
MKKNRSRQNRQKSENFQLVRERELRHSGLEDAFDALLQTCTRLSIAERKQFIFLLLQQIFLPAGTACYLEWGEQDPPNIRSIYLNVSDISTDLAESWFEWARALFNEGSSCCPQERVYCLIGALTEQVSMEEVKRWFQAHRLRLPREGFTCR